MIQHSNNRWYGPTTQEDFDKINELWGKEMNMIEFFYKCMSPKLQAEVDEACIEFIKTYGK